MSTIRLANNRAWSLPSVRLADELVALGFWLLAPGETCSAIARLLREDNDEDDDENYGANPDVHGYPFSSIIYLDVPRTGCVNRTGGPSGRTYDCSERCGTKLRAAQRRRRQP